MHDLWGPSLSCRCFLVVVFNFFFHPKNSKAVHTRDLRNLEGITTTRSVDQKEEEEDQEEKREGGGGAGGEKKRRSNCDPNYTQHPHLRLDVLLTDPYRATGITPKTNSIVRIPKKKRNNKMNNNNE